jgi:hypothetical protein
VNNRTDKYFSDRNNWLIADDDEFLRDCKLDWFQASGPGGQKRNRKYSAVRLLHLPTKIFVEEVHSRSQNNNRHNAIKKLKLQIAVTITGPEIGVFRYNVSMSNNEYPVCIARVFDILRECEFSVSESAIKLHLSTSKLVKFLGRDEFLWREVNNKREKLGMKRLRI